MDYRMIPTIVKLGGSVITFKEREASPNLPAITRVANEIAKTQVKSLIIIHGGGSFGHPVAKEYQIVEGYRSAKQLLGLSKTRQAMMTINKIVVDALIDNQLPAVSIQPSSCILTKEGTITHFDFTPIRKLLLLGMIPVLYGDAVLDLSRGFTILSGDQITTKLAVHFHSTNIVIAVDVDGLFTENPKVHPKADLIEEISLRQLKEFLERIGKALTTDVTRGMQGKIVELIPALEHGAQITMVNALKSNRLYKALKGEKVLGTTFVQG